MAAAFSNACGRRKPVELDLLSFRSTGVGAAAAAKRFGKGQALRQKTFGDRPISVE